MRSSKGTTWFLEMRYRRLRHDNADPARKENDERKEKEKPMTTIPIEPTINYEALARSFLDGLDGLQQNATGQLGGLLTVGATVRKRMNSTAAVPDKFIIAVASMLEEQPLLGSLSPRTAGKMKDVLALTGALDLIASRLEAMARTYRETIAARRYEVGADALRMYSVAKGMNRTNDPAELVPNVPTVQQALGRTGRISKAVKAAKAAKAAQAAAPAVDTPAVTAKAAK
jgi:hypothetical protein